MSFLSLHHSFLQSLGGLTMQTASLCYWHPRPHPSIDHTFAKTTTLHRCMGCEDKFLRSFTTKGGAQRVKSGTCIMKIPFYLCPSLKRSRHIYEHKDLHIRKSISMRVGSCFVSSVYVYVCVYVRRCTHISFWIEGEEFVAYYKYLP